jgi:hypothetical protein
VDKLHLQKTCCKDGDMIEVALNSVHWRGRIGGVVVSVLATGPKGVPRGWIFKGDKIPQHTDGKQSRRSHDARFYGM